MPVEALLTHAPTYSSQWMAALVAALPQIIIDLPIYTMIYERVYVLKLTLEETKNMYTLYCIL